MFDSAAVKFLLNILIFISPPFLFIVLAVWAYRVKKEREKRLNLKWKIEEIFPEE
ncbi:MAG: hypothetical protein NT099_03230 [Candidatus Saganbacteria bacterium]|nr:hypothetical protein [Candidatus Saganbacteria bacterium]